ncbi:MAG: GHKL domain-containing protein [Gammaproteobacteria bacterium]|nr:MAG: GHKL domain-containing protein [Gammaproteobacteria bacterium]
MRSSITRRLLIATTALMAAFIGIAGWSLDSAFRNASETALAERLQAHVYTLLATAREDRQGRLRMPADLPDPAFNRPDSGRYARIIGEDGGYRWSSRSLVGRRLPLPAPLSTGKTALREVDGLIMFDQAIEWEDFGGRPLPYMVSVAVDAGNLALQQQSFRNTLWSWLGVLGVVLLLVQLAAVRWGLTPLFRIADAIKQIEQGKRQQLPRDVPRELKPLTENLDALLAQSRARQERVRTALADLAHSMKTPLTVLRGIAESAPDPELARLVDEQVSRIDEIVDYQRQRAAVSGSTGLSSALALRPPLERLLRGLSKLHADRQVQASLDIPSRIALKFDPGDLMELFGNLLENAFKHARRQVRVTASGRAPLTITIEDDGEGIPEALATRLLERGVRADERHPGEGIGLAVVNEILSQYEAEIRIDRSPLGGARFTLDFPERLVLAEA